MSHFFLFVVVVPELVVRFHSIDYSKYHFFFFEIQIRFVFIRVYGTTEQREISLQNLKNKTLQDTLKMK